MLPFTFKLLHQDTKTRARLGVIQTPHGNISTPAFVPVGTQGTVKTLTPQELTDLSVPVFFVNTYHMYLRPGMDVIKKFGGLHRFMSWNGPIMTDSGGFQVFSLARRKPYAKHRDDEEVSGDLVKISEEGVEFRSHWDGSKHMFTPKFSMELQWQLGSDIHIAFDDCPPYPVTQQKAKKSMERTHRWAKESLEAHRKLSLRDRSHGEAISIEKDRHALWARDDTNYQALYGSIQGSTFEDLRKESAAVISDMDFDGIAIGGVAVGESKGEMVKVLDWVTPILPVGKPRHLLGVGEIDDIFELVSRGMDTFDCVAPTRLARMGRLYTRSKIKDQHSKFTIDITKQEYKLDTQPIDSDCGCYTCRHFSRAYLCHLFHVRELLAYHLATMHNIFFIQKLMGEIRDAIFQGTFLELKEKWLYNISR